MLCNVEYINRILSLDLLAQTLHHQNTGDIEDKFTGRLPSSYIC